MYPEMNELIEQYFLSASFLTLRSFQSQRYAAPQQEEIEAERSIHVEAIERSRASQADLGRSMMNEEDDGESSLGGGYAPDDFGGGDDDGDFPRKVSKRPLKRRSQHLKQLCYWTRLQQETFWDLNPTMSISIARLWKISKAICGPELRIGRR
jgi:hypothetical protein